MKTVREPISIPSCLEASRCLKNVIPTKESKVRTWRNAEPTWTANFQTTLSPYPCRTILWIVSQRGEYPESHIKVINRNRSPDGLSGFSIDFFTWWRLRVHSGLISVFRHLGQMSYTGSCLWNNEEWKDMKEVTRSATFQQDDLGQVTYLSVTSFLSSVSGI